ncbi:RidA family protein [Nocardioides sp.]|uniref:RidA family protein n=1 Tax=Nocardioides sp. TaxID=35761 RepID=UPI003568CB0B
MTDRPPNDVVLPSILPLGPAGEVLHPGDFVAQYAWCLDRAGELLAEHGLSLANAVTTYDFSTPATREVYRRTHRERKARLGGAGVFPGAGGILLDDVGHPEALVRLEVTASPLPLTGVNPGWSRYETLTYYPGVLAGRTLHMSGFAALDMETQQALHEGDLLAQARTTYAAIVEVIAEAGGGPEHLTSLVEYVCPDALGQEHLLDQARIEVFGPDAPAAERHPCAGLLRPEFLVEVFPTAVLP